MTIRLDTAFVTIVPYGIIIVGPSVGHVIQDGGQQLPLEFNDRSRLYLY